MPARHLLALDRFADVAPREIKQRDPALFAELQTRVLGRARAYLRGSLPRMSRALREHLTKIDLPLGDWPADRTPRDIVLDALRSRRAAPKVRAEATALLDQFERAGLIPTPADLGKSIRELPFFEQELRQAAVAKLADAARLPEEKAERLLQQIDSISSLNEDRLAELVSSGTLQPDEARRLTMTTSLYYVADEHLPLANALAAERFDSLSGRSVTQLRDLAALTANEWERVLTDTSAPLEPGLDPKSAATGLERTMAAMFATDALLARVLPKDAAAIVPPALERLARVLSADVLTRPLSDLDLERFSPEEVDAAKEAHAELRRLVNLHPGLRLAELLGSSVSTEEKLKTLQLRLGLLDHVTRLNPDMELLTLDFDPESADMQVLELEGLELDEQEMVLSELKAYQRVFGVTDNVLDSVRMLGAGYPSARAAATESFDVFRANTGFPETTARNIHIEARQILADTSMTLMTIVEAVRGDFGLIKGSANVEARPMYAYLNKLEGFADLFGNQDYCKCDHCQSILGPAAYFVDLMCFAEEHALGVFKGSKTTHPLSLKARRPDLWTLELTCENTNTLVPTLDIINPILENAIAKKLNFAGDYSDRAAVEEEVYHKAMSTSVDSFRQPFTFPLEKLTIYLTHFERSRADVARMLGASGPVLAAAVLGLSEREYELVTQPNVSLGFLRKVYGIQFAVTNGIVNPIDVQEMLKFTGLSRSDFGRLIATNYVTADGADPVEIKAEKKSADSLQNDVERVHKLKLAALDRVHRLTRLWRRLGWSVPEVDLTLTHLDAAALSSDIGPAALDHFATMVSLRTRWSNLPVEQALALWSTIPAATVAEGRDALLNRLFNVAPFVTVDGPLPNAAVSFVHPSLRLSGAPLPSDNTLNRLLAGLQLGEESLGQLITKLAVPLGANLAAVNEDARGFFLSLNNLSLLYRHARLAQLLRIPIADLFQLAELAGISAGHVATIADLDQLLEFHTWWRSSGFKLDDLGFVTKGPMQVASQYADPAAVAAQIVADLTADRSLQFADTVFAFLPGVTEDQSRQIVAANAVVIEPTPDGSALRLRNTFDPAAPLVIPPGIALAEPAARAALLKHHAVALVPLRIAAFFAFTQDKAAELVAMTGAQLASAPLVDALWGGPIASLADIVQRAAPLAVLFRNTVFDAAALQFIRTNPSLFGIADFNAISVGAVRKLSLYREWTDPARVADHPAAEALPDAAAVRSVLGAFDPVTKFAGADPAELSRGLRLDPVLVATLLPNLDLPPLAPEAFDMVGRAGSLASALGIGGEALRLMISQDYDDLTRASDAVLSTLRALYADEKEFADRMEPLLDRLRSRRRDGLTDFMIRSSHPQFDSLNDLYAYYLLDVQLEGCARTSRLVAAISSVQLYIHRCILDLEQDNLPPSNANKIHVILPPEALTEWVWRKNYRVWEANRRVFIHTEHFIEPELRDDKTPLFKELESTLLQQRLDEQNVLDAYAGYLTGLEEVTRLKIAGSYHDIGADRDVLHLFGVLPGDPPLYYYRTVENAYHGEVGKKRTPVYTPWRKIDVQIPVRHVSPIVHQGRLFVFWVEIASTPKNEVVEGGSKFVGYKHKLTIKYTTLRLDGEWTAPQSITLARTGVFEQGEGIVNDPLSGQVPLFSPIGEPHEEPVDGYTLEGFQFDRVYPGKAGQQLELTGRNYLMRAPVDFYRKLLKAGSSAQKKTKVKDGQVLCARPEAGARKLYYGVQNKFVYEPYAHCTLVADVERLNVMALGESQAAYNVACANEGLYKQAIARLGSDDQIDIINGAVTDAILDCNGDLLLLQGSVRSGPDYLLKRLGTTLTSKMVKTLFMTGVDGLLATATQQSLKEASVPIVVLSHIENAANSGKLDFKGPYGTYYRELFFHIPFLIANHLNSQQRFGAAQAWYHYIFDPTSTEQITIPPNLPADEQTAKLRNRVWRYLEFRDLAVPKLKEILADPETIEIYRKDPFNPHAIARLRLTAYQKCIVLKYIDNLLDWGDSLFAQFTTESLNEATMLYVMAADILGARPAELGDCGEAKISPRTYEKIGPLMKAGHGFLGEVETMVTSKHSRIRARGSHKRAANYVLRKSDVMFYKKKAQAIHAGASAPLVVHVGAAEPVMAHAGAVDAVGAGPGGSTPVVLHATVFDATGRAGTAPAADMVMIGSAGNDVASAYGWQGTYLESWHNGTKASERSKRVDSPLKDHARAAGFQWSVARQIVPVFCVPPNKDLLAYWDRVEDRLYKLRHCLDINGVFRRPALFAPEIDPRLLVRARAAGLSLDDVINATSGNLPPYRFSYLIEKAKQAAATIQAFGAALLSALEKKDVEELNRLRMVHQQNLMKLTTRMRDWDITIAADTITALERQQESVQYRRDYYQSLVDKGLTVWEHVQQKSRHLASGLAAASSALDMLSGISHLLPEAGSPFSLKYGGKQAGDSSASWAAVSKDAALVAEAVASAAGLEAGFDRREEGWEHQVELADRELAQLTKQHAAATLRKEIAIRALALHTESMKQIDEVMELYGDRFSTLGFYTWLSTMLQRTYREAYNGAFAMARLAEQAYRYERGDETTPLLQMDYWEPTKAGLLAGDRMMVDLQSLERRFIETNYRKLEIDQAFSLTQIDPRALVELREKGACEFELPELFFELFYPGQYRRRITSARLTMPCLTGPYTNVSATLTLTGSRIRHEPKLGDAHLTDIPLRRSVSVATSTAQNDAGVFEFNFRDERYMPFEGAGAVSSWRLELPKSFRQFDYQTITDVILHVSYTAEADGLFRTNVEQQNAAIEGTILNVLTNVPIRRLLSLRQDFSATFHRLLHSPIDTSVPIEINDKFLPIFLRGRSLTVTKATLLLRVASGQTISGVQLALDGATQSGFAVDPTLGGLPGANVTGVLAGGLLGIRTLAVKAAGNLGLDPPVPGDVSVLDGDKLHDILLYVEVQVQ